MNIIDEATTIDQIDKVLLYGNPTKAERLHLLGRRAEIIASNAHEWEKVVPLIADGIIGEIDTIDHKTEE